MSFPIHIFTIVLDGMPFLPMQLATFNHLRPDWTWHVVHGAAANVKCTSWCQRQEARLSTDGTTEFLNQLVGHPRVKIYQRQWWEGGKVQMCNEALRHIQEPCVLMQIDCDEIWSPEQIGNIVSLLSPPTSTCRAEFYCRYFLGPNIIITGGNAYGNRMGEWRRAWLFEPGMLFTRHEPPEMNRYRCDGLLPRDTTRLNGLVFDHHSYVFEQQLAYKQKFYGYSDAVNLWRRLQRNRDWPVKDLRFFLPWVDRGVTADLLYK